MKSFRSYIKEAVSIEANQHIFHVEDKMILEGQDGLKKIIELFEEIINDFSGIKGSSLQMKFKFDGCIHPDTILKLKEKDICIGEMIFDSSKKYCVLTHNFNTGKDEYQDAIRPRVNNNNKEWIKIEFENENFVLVTEDHEFYVNGKGWKKAKDLEEIDNILEIDKNDIQLNEK